MVLGGGWHHHPDLLAPGSLEQASSSGLPDVDGLSTQDVGSEASAFHGDDDAVDEAGPAAADWFGRRCPNSAEQTAG